MSRQHFPNDEGQTRCSTLVQVKVVSMIDSKRWSSTNETRPWGSNVLNISLSCICSSLLALKFPPNKYCSGRACLVGPSMEDKITCTVCGEPSHTVLVLTITPIVPHTAPKKHYSALAFTHCHHTPTHNRPIVHPITHHKKQILGPKIHARPMPLLQRNLKLCCMPPTCGCSS